MLLGDQGADVIKVERPDGGDQMRRYGRKAGKLTAPFVNNNRNKRSVAVDLKSPEGVDVVKRLAAGADVVVQNFRPGVVERLGLGEPALRKVRSDSPTGALPLHTLSSQINRPCRGTLRKAP